MSDQVLQKEKVRGGVAQSLEHDSATKHVTGQAIYVDDIPEPHGTLHIATGHAGVAFGNITSVNLETVRSAPGVVCVLTVDDIPGLNDVSPTHSGDDPVLTGDEVKFYGQPVFAVAAETVLQAQAAAKLGVIECNSEEPVLTIEQALEKNYLIGF